MLSLTFTVLLLKIYFALSRQSKSSVKITKLSQIIYSEKQTLRLAYLFNHSSNHPMFVIPSHTQYPRVMWLVVTGGSGDHPVIRWLTAHCSPVRRSAALLPAADGLIGGIYGLGMRRSDEDRKTDLIYLSGTLHTLSLKKI